MTNYLIVDASNRAVNSVALDIPEGGRMVEYEGPFYPGGLFDGTTVSEPVEP